MHLRVDSRPSILLWFVCFVMSSLTLVAQVNGRQQQPHGDAPAPDRFDIYAGYGYIHPVNSDINNYQYQPVYNPNATLSFTGYFNRYLGVQVEGGYFSGGNSDVLATQCASRGAWCQYKDPNYYTAEAGPVVRYQWGRIVPFAHVLGGAARVSGPINQPPTWGWATTGGVGVDYVLPWWHNRIAVRPIQADFHFSHVDYGPLVLPFGQGGGVGDIYAYKLSGGLVARFGSVAEPQPVQLACPVSPAVIFAGDPLSVTAQALNLIPGRKTAYEWKASGGRLTPGDGGASIATEGLTPGDYTVTGHVTQGKRTSQQASCQGMFTVKPYEPPTVACSATPSTVLPGASSTISTTGMSPQNRPLSYAFSSSAGQVTGTGATATLSTTGVPPGTITVTCNVVDDLGKTATANTTVTVTAPPQQVVIPQTQALCSASFERDRKRPARVDNEAKACLDDVALNLNRDPSARLVVVGKYSSDEQPLAGEERSVNIRTYLVEKGVDGSRVEVRVGDNSGRGADNVLVPSGATFSGGGSVFDPSSVKPPVYRAPARRGTSRRHRHVSKQ
jgi:hypothetical protein